MPTYKHLDLIEIHEVETTADVNRYLAEKCVTTGLEASLGSILFGVTVVPLALRKHHHRIPIRYEYKLAIGVVTAMVGSYFIGSYAKKKCEEKVRKELAARFLET